MSKERQFHLYWKGRVLISTQRKGRHVAELFELSEQLRQGFFFFEIETHRCCIHYFYECKISNILKKKSVYLTGTFIQEIPCKHKNFFFFFLTLGVVQQWNRLPEKLWSFWLRRYSKPGLMQPSATCCSWCFSEQGLGVGHLQSCCLTSAVLGLCWSTVGHSMFVQKFLFQAVHSFKKKFVERKWQEQLHRNCCFKRTK